MVDSGHERYWPRPVHRGKALLLQLHDRPTAQDCDAHLDAVLIRRLRWHGKWWEGRRRKREVHPEPVCKHLGLRRPFSAPDLLQSGHVWLQTFEHRDDSGLAFSPASAEAPPQIPADYSHDGILTLGFFI